jgi:TusA-related sulfurtransferase
MRKEMEKLKVGDLMKVMADDPVLGAEGVLYFRQGEMDV